MKLFREPSYRTEPFRWGYRMLLLILIPAVLVPSLVGLLFHKPEIIAFGPGAGLGLSAAAFVMDRIEQQMTKQHERSE